MVVEQQLLKSSSQSPALLFIILFQPLSVGVSLHHSDQALLAVEFLPEFGNLFIAGHRYPVLPSEAYLTCRDPESQDIKQETCKQLYHRNMTDKRWPETLAYK
jgi:hypothetical protein